MNHHKTPIQHRTLISFAIGLCLISTISGIGSSHAQSTATVAQAFDSCSPIKNLAISEASIDDAQFRNETISSITTEYEKYRESVNDDFLGPLEVIAKQNPDQRTESFVFEESNLDIEQTKTAFLCFHASVQDALANLDARSATKSSESDSNLREDIAQIDQAAQEIQEAIINPLDILGFNKLNDIFVGQRKDKASVIEKIQAAIPSLAENPVVQASPGVYNELTFQGIAEFIASQNAVIEENLGLRETTPLEDSSSPKYSPWLLGFMGLPLLAAIYFLPFKRKKPQKGSPDYAQKNATYSPPQTLFTQENQPLEVAPINKVLPKSPPAQAEIPSKNSQTVSKEVVELKQEISKLPEQIDEEQMMPEVSETPEPEAINKDVEAKNIESVQKVSSLSEQALISQYNLDYTELNSVAYPFEQTASSLRNYLQGSNCEIQLEARTTGKYWRISSTTTEPGIFKHYLALRKDIFINEQALTTVNACFLIHNESAARNGFDLVSPATVELRVGLWTLVRKGEIRFQPREQQDEDS